MIDRLEGLGYVVRARRGRTLALDFDTIIPGHGPIATKADLVAFNADLVTMRTRLAGLSKSGTSRAEVVRVLEAD